MTTVVTGRELIELAAAGVKKAGGAMATRRLSDDSTASFNYNDLPQDVAKRTHQRAVRIRKRVGELVELIGRIGQELLDVRSELNRGLFLLWIRDELDLSTATAYRWMDCAQNLGAELLTLRSLKASTIYCLAAKSTPQSEREAIVREFASGNALSDFEVRGRLKASRATARRQTPAPAKEKTIGARLPAPEQETFCDKTFSHDIEISNDTKLNDLGANNTDETHIKNIANFWLQRLNYTILLRSYVCAI